jgi:energy-coupling factor transporter ATP-binding protein EcfA2
LRIDVHKCCSDFKSYRAARVKSLFNAESGCNFDLVADLPIDDSDWRIGLIIGPSGSGKTSLGRRIFGPEALYEPKDWPTDRPIVDAIAPDGDFDAVTGALAAVGLGSVPSWLRPYPVLSNGEKFRADLARIVCEAPEHIVIDEFTSVVDRQIAKFGALAFQKAWRRTKGQAVLLSCHYDIIEWVEPDWVFDTATGKFAGRGLWRRPRFDLEIWQTDWRYWGAFEPHHYLKLPKMIAARCYVGTVDGELVAHVAVGTRNVGRGVEARACRLVIMPEWQGAGIGMRFLNEVCQLQLEGKGRLPGRKVTTLFHTSHPGLCAALRRDRKWVQLSAVLHGANKVRSKRSMEKSGGSRVGAAGYGGHFRAVQGFRYLGGR